MNRQLFFKKSDVVKEIAAKYADSVDLEGRFPCEAVTALKAERLLSIQIPTELGGESATITEIAALCTVLGQACAATAMIFAMHQIKLSSLVEHGEGSDWHRDFMRRIARDQLLLASATTEGGIGGNMRNSICAIRIEGDICFLEKDATVISYGAHADAILITSRAHADAAPSDQVLTAFLKHQYTLDRTSVWDTLGMRGTCSDGFVFKGEAPAVQILPRPFAEIAAQSMLATSHLLWSALWYGIAADAVARAQAFVRAAARKSPGTPPPGALRLAEVSGQLQMVKSNVVAALKVYEDAKLDADRLSSMAFAVAMNNVKIVSSEAILPIINHAMLICGIMGYKNGTPYSLGRHLRDAHSAQLMISNDRILANTSTMLLVHKQDTNLLG
ncbi:acyl-CoA/acyl-ACP dehydrogenase [Rhizobium sp. VS19-DR104.2]|uniref:acyl-CoA dehydrogenase family protein n=1 Tax=unclassified Rhizobium TaxID=2613769 RepID=UPI001CC54263|nr:MULTISPECIES: acyl-CoA dehydrogenase family protein [unclassified Rhizobium]MBZ5763057.1 acyl-CoA/acyl-ACP dehydrogenase [Rhizobium sp. VS19-DR96]MBZ5769607.1 acyl-CoA/acyl-ACP dehydrogenase [Rhizobium sp. VS19-DR129.2]MBZ5776365.1 acyl-CoA/acyl-ACP dehydrogenase [Rhizobium sp. VS19-DRK62.2]MBZ5787572.1 acyl-CoA/acyl-ACP dehydrogenase [Rhizobium sp. VS19-DR121]MBZ5804927.1 acyl-CoA/acyl-ACP dehydrogenase [Rhizobium sp. VS19-DR181]